MFEYNICTEADQQLFYRQCAALEKHIPGLVKGKLLHDVDDSLVQLYTKNGKEIRVHNDLYIDALYIKSELDIDPYFQNSPAKVQAEAVFLCPKGVVNHDRIYPDLPFTAVCKRRNRSRRI